MSVYLLAFVISDFEVITKTSSTATIHRVFARSDAISSANLALENSILFLNELESYAMTKYELPKMDHAAIPDFAFGNLIENPIELITTIKSRFLKFQGAMENWGLIIYKETNLIGDENSHHYDYLRILQVVAHELGHQFFGNLVTLEWWNYTWLNEGFATLFEYLLVERVYPNYRIRDFFNVVKVHNSMVIDSVESTHPITWNGPTIGPIIYDKGELISPLGVNLISIGGNFSWKRHPNVPKRCRRNDFPRQLEEIFER
jgi:aminopeptidase N